MRLRRDGAGTVPEQASAAVVEERQTLLLGQVFEGLDEETPLTVLDVGGGVAETVGFLSRYRCRLHFAGLYDLDGLEVPADEDPESHYRARLASLLEFPAGTRFDVCLLWDFLNYLPVAALRAFAAELQPFLHQRTVGHGFGAFKATAPGASRQTSLAAIRYGIAAADRLVARPRQDGLIHVYAHSRKVLDESFSCFEITRGTLLQGGAMELLFQAR